MNIDIYLSAFHACWCSVFDEAHACCITTCADGAYWSHTCTGDACRLIHYIDVNVCNVQNVRVRFLMYVCVGVCVRVCIRYIHIYGNKYVYIYIYKCIYMYTYIYIYQYMYMYVDQKIYT